MNWNEIYRRNFVAQAIPLKGLKGRDLREVIMLQVDSQKCIDAFESRMTEALKKLKAEQCPKFDEESQKPEESRCKEYKQWLSDLEKAYTEMRAAEAVKEAEGVTVPKVTLAVLDAVCADGAEGDIDLTDGRKIPRAGLVSLVATMVE